MRAQPTPVAAVLAEAGNAPDTSPSATAAAEADVVSLRQESAAAAATDGAGQPTDGVTPPPTLPLPPPTPLQPLTLRETLQLASHQVMTH